MRMTVKQAPSKTVKTDNIQCLNCFLFAYSFRYYYLCVQHFSKEEASIICFFLQAEERERCLAQFLSFDVEAEKGQ